MHFPRYAIAGEHFPSLDNLRYRLARALPARQVPHAAHVFAHGPHSLSLAHGAGDAAIWTALAGS